MIKKFFYENYEIYQHSNGEKMTIPTQQNNSNMEELMHELKRFTKTDLKWKRNQKLAKEKDFRKKKELNKKQINIFL